MAPGLEPGSRSNLELTGYKPAALPFVLRQENSVGQTFLSVEVEFIQAGQTRKFPFIIFHFSFAIHDPSQHGFLLRLQTGFSSEMTNEKWKMTNGKSGLLFTLE